MKGKLSYILPALMIAAGIISWGIGMAISSHTLSPRWTSLTAAAVLALTSLPITLRSTRKSTTTQKILRGILHVFIVGGVGFMAIMGINRLGATEDKAETVTGEVTKRIRHRHTRYRRISRNRYAPAPDGHYYTYGAIVTLPDGQQTEQYLSLEEYNRTRTGAKREVTIARGWLGMPVVISVKKLSKNKETDGLIRKKTAKERKN